MASSLASSSFTTSTHLLGLHPHLEIWTRLYFDDPDHLLHYVAMHAPLLPFGRYGSNESCASNVVSSRLARHRSIIPAQIGELVSSVDSSSATMTHEDVVAAHEIATIATFQLGSVADICKSPIYQEVAAQVQSWSSLRRKIHLHLLKSPFGMSSTSLFRECQEGAVNAHARWLAYFSRLCDTVEMPTSIRSDANVVKVVVDDEGICAIILGEGQDTVVWLIHQSKLSTSSTSSSPPATAQDKAGAAGSKQRQNIPASDFQVQDMSVIADKILKQMSATSSLPMSSLVDYSTIFCALVDLWLKAKFNTACANFRSAITSQQGRSILRDYCNRKLGGDGVNYDSVQDLIAAAEDEDESIPMDPVWFVVTFNVLDTLAAFVASKSKVAAVSKNMLTLWYFRLMHHAIITSEDKVEEISVERQKRERGDRRVGNASRRR